MSSNRQIRLATRPVGVPEPSVWKLTEEPIPTANDGELVVQVLYLSLDPAMRGWMNEGKSYVPPVGIGEVMRAGAIGRVIASKHPGFAVGAVAGQLAKLHGCRAIGIAGGADKCKYLVDTLKLDAAIDYKNEDVKKALRTHCPNGIDVYFDNVGGDILDAALANLARGARVVICGAISQYNSTAWKGPANYMSLLVNRATMTGMVVFDWAARYPEAGAKLAGWLAQGKLVSREDVVEGGIAAFHATLLKLFKGENFGKLVLKL